MLCIAVFVSCGILISDNKITVVFLENKYVIFIGEISFSIYMWHQIILAFGRYLIFHKIETLGYFIIFIITITLSIFTF